MRGQQIAVCMKVQKGFFGRKLQSGFLDSIERLKNFSHSGSQTPDKWLNTRRKRMDISLFLLVFL